MTTLFGIHAVLEALRAEPDRIERVTVQRGLYGPRLQEVIDLARRLQIPLSFEERTWMDRRAAGVRHQGILCNVAEAVTLSVEDILNQALIPGLLLILDGIEDPQNLGAILRSAEVAGVDGVLLRQRRSVGLSASAVKASAGAASHVKVARFPNTSRTIELVKKRGYWVTGLAGEVETPLWEVDFSLPAALVLGSEGRGLGRLVRENCDLLVSIPTRGRVNSYNVSVAAGIALYEILRQRSSVPPASAC